MTIKTAVIAIQDRSMCMRIGRQVASLPDFKVKSVARDLMSTFAEVEHFEPSVVIIAKSLTLQPEFEVMRGLFSTLDIRWLVLCDIGSDKEKDTNRASDLFELSVDEPLGALASQLRSVTRAEAVPASVNIAGGGKNVRHGHVGDRVILIGASTGGVDALLTILRNFGPDCPPTLVVQHTGSGFGASLASLLDRQCPARVTHVNDDMDLMTGTVLVGAGSNAHLVLDAAPTLRARLMPGPATCGHIPSVDVLFRSSVPLGNRVVAALLTGMGRDGGEAMRALRNAGAKTIAQDEATSIVFGMPKAAIDAGGASEVLPIDKIGPALLWHSKAAPKQEQSA